MSNPASGCEFDVVVIGSGPAGQKAAIQAAKAGKRVAVIERDRQVGGACVHTGTIPSKSLREHALRQRVRRLDLSEQPMQSLLDGVGETVAAHDSYMAAQLERNHIALLRGRASFIAAGRDESNALHTLGMRRIDGSQTRVSAPVIIVATGSRPRTPPHLAADHEHVLDSDSLLSLVYLPRSMTVLGAGVIACEYASVFAALGTSVTIVDKGPRPLAFLDPELAGAFQRHFERNRGCRFLGGRKLRSVRFDGVAEVVTELEGGEVLRAEKVLCALGREANLRGLCIENAGLRANARGLLDVDAHLRTAVPHVYAVGDVIGPPSLAATAMEQGRRAVRHWLGLPVDAALDVIPTGIYTIPEIASVGLDAAHAAARHGTALVGRAHFAELARGQIAGVADGILLLVADPAGQEVLGAQIAGEGATELIHLAQLAMLGGLRVDALVDHVFNFPTLAEAYRVAALDVVRQRVPAAAASVR